MDTKTTSIGADITWMGLLIAFCAGDREGAKFHLNQALVIFLFGLLGWIPCIGWIWSIFMLGHGADRGYQSGREAGSADRADSASEIR